MLQQGRHLAATALRLGLDTQEEAMTHPGYAGDRDLARVHRLHHRRDPDRRWGYVAG
jgi:hypothetical protein